MKINKEKFTSFPNSNSSRHLQEDVDVCLLRRMDNKADELKAVCRLLTTFFRTDYSCSEGEETLIDVFHDGVSKRPTTSRWYPSIQHTNDWCSIIQYVRSEDADHVQQMFSISLANVTQMQKELPKCFLAAIKKKGENLTGCELPLLFEVGSSLDHWRAEQLVHTVGNNYR